MAEEIKITNLITELQDVRVKADLSAVENYLAYLLSSGVPCEAIEIRIRNGFKYIYIIEDKLNERGGLYGSIPNKFS